MVFGSLTHRCRQPEVLDDPALDTPRLFGSLRGLARINRASGASRLLWAPVKRLLRDQAAPIRILDLATGGGDIPLSLWRCARRAGLPLQVEGCDVNPRSVAYARQRAHEQKADVRFFQLDAVGEKIPPGYDVLMCSLFLHHLGEPQVVSLLRQMARAAGRLMLVNDLRRSRLGFVLAYVGTRVLSRCDVVHTDGPRSVRSAFTIPEIKALAGQAGLGAVHIRRRWPFRFLLSWRRSG